MLRRLLPASACRTLASFSSTYLRMRHYSSKQRNDSMPRQRRDDSTPRQRRDNSMPTIQLDDALKESSAEILSRIHVVAKESTCAEIVERILKRGAPVAVDMEGITRSGQIGLVQVRDSEGEIFLFRTAVNKRLLAEGRLKEMLECPDLVKVFHASQGDLLCLYQSGIELWNLFDTAVAHRVAELQCSGASVTCSATASLNALCDAYAVPQNPLKGFMKRNLFLRVSEFERPAELRQDMMLYCAWDVEPLLDLHELVASRIDADYRAVLEEHHEIELLRAIDPELAKLRSRSRTKIETNSVFLSSLPSTVNKADLYMLAAKHDGYKKVLFSPADSTAQIVLPDRPAAIAVFKSLSASAGLPESVFGEDASVKLVHELKAEEIAAGEVVGKAAVGKLRDDNYIVDASVSSELVKRLLATAQPVVVDFRGMSNGGVTMDLFVGVYPVIKFVLGPEMITQGGLGELMASNSVTKVVLRVDSVDVTAALKMCAAAGFEPRRFFDLNFTYKLIDYWHHGQSAFKSAACSLRDMTTRLGLTSHTVRAENVLFMYSHLIRILPAYLLDVADAKCQAEVSAWSGVNVAEAREARKQLRIRLETHTAHVECERGSPETMEKVLTALAERHGIPLDLINVAGRFALVEVSKPSDVFRLGELLKSTNLEGLVLTARHVEIRNVVDRATLQPINVPLMQQNMIAAVENLDKTGFFDVLALMRKASEQ